MFERKQVAVIRERMLEQDNPTMQVIVGPRQTGKSTMISQALQTVNLLAYTASADDLYNPSQEWLCQQWQHARNLQETSSSSVILVLDEIQKVKHWPTIIKGLWDADRRNNSKLKVFLSGSSSLLLRKGLEDSLMGRFELIRSPHWSFQECHEAFGYSLDDFLFFGGFPGAARYVADEQRWRDYMRVAIVEPTISQDAIEDEDVRKPALMRALFALGVRFSAQELSYTKMLGQLQDAGNTTTLAHYLALLNKAGILCGLEKYHPKQLVRAKSSPRLLAYDTSLMTSTLELNKDALLANSELRGHLVETAVGAHLLVKAQQYGYTLSWWREGTHEVDYVLSGAAHTFALEVKSGRIKSLNGMSAFLQRYPEALSVVVGGTTDNACTLEDFLSDKVTVFPWCQTRQPTS